ncbi:hypothetical protein QBC46DRAFT_414169 [Diplogelasinospora grovesii]|uniref:Uncharacterized protein n=1 Tax=Diplogelasinospora grovesii TaxID=303347 RepID=A0AAN6RYS1_9PEZI|nr:hypothetical protein QBC46DRAFT_414169 [Diplogelasinospora grovesii]
MFNSQQPNLSTFRPPGRPRQNAQIPPRAAVNSTAMGLNFPRHRPMDGQGNNRQMLYGGRPSLVPMSNSPSDGVERDGNPTLEAKLDNISHQLGNSVAMFGKLHDVVDELSSQVTSVTAVLQALIENMNVWTSDIEGLVRQQVQPQREEPLNADWLLE